MFIHTGQGDAYTFTKRNLTRLQALERVIKTVRKAVVPKFRPTSSSHGEYSMRESVDSELPVWSVKLATLPPRVPSVICCMCNGCINGMRNVCVLI